MFVNVGETTVPNVENKPLIEAKAELEEAGLSYTVDYENSSSVEENYVISQTIPGNQMVKKTRVIGLLVSEGPKNTLVPNVVGKSQRDAEVALNNSNLNPSFTDDYSDEVPAGTVISQDPQAGNEVPEDSTVSVVVST